MADARFALAEAVGISDFDKAPSSRSSTINYRVGWLFVCSDFFAVFIGLFIAAPLVGLFAPSIGLAAFPEGHFVLDTTTVAQQLVLNAALGVGAAVCFWLSGHYERGRDTWDTLADVGLVVGLLFAVHVALDQMMFHKGTSLIVVCVGWGLASLILIGGRRTLRHQLVTEGTWLEPAVIVGEEERVMRLADVIRADADVGLDVTHVIKTRTQQDGEPALAATNDTDTGIMRSNGFLADLIFRFRRHAVLFCPSPDEYETTGRLLQSVGGMGSRTGIVFPFPGFAPTGNTPHAPLSDGTMVIWVRNRLANPVWRAIKRAIDIVGSAVLLVFLSPALLALALPSLLKGEPILFGHRRLGQHGQPFTCYKFRTMVTNASEILETLLATDEDARKEWEASYKLKNDPRVTRIGQILRRTSLDELPQLWNVLKGDMSLVGPRPIVENELSYYGDDALSYFSVKPGITGLWQVSGRSDACYDKRVAFDRRYVRHWSLLNDLIILFKTVRVVMTRAGAY